MMKNYILKITLFVTVGLTAFLVSCDPAKKYEKQEAESIQTYISSNPNLSFVKKPSGLYYLDIQEGTGRAAATHDTAYVKYTLKLLNGFVMDTNVGTTKTLSFAINEGHMIAGFDEGITYMKAGGKAMLLIPSSLAYGAGGFYSIQGYTPLLFDIELVQVKSGVAK